MKKYICSHPGCDVLLDARGYCPKHVPVVVKKDWRDAKTKPFENAKRYNEELYKTPRWQALRQEVLERDGYRCQHCGLPFNSLQVHHKIRPMGNEDLFFDPNNCESVCISCHRTETQRQTKE